MTVMRKKLLGVALFACAAGSAGAASAQSLAGNWYNPGYWWEHGQVYVGADGGYHFPEPLDARSLRPDFASGQPLRWQFGSDHDNWAAFGKLGYEHESGLRVEFEYGYRSGELRSIHGSTLAVAPYGICRPNSVPIGGGGVCGGLNGGLNVTTEMFNVLYDFKHLPRIAGFAIHPFIGAGVGGAFVQTKAYGQLYSVPGGFSGLENVNFDDEKSAFAYQGLAGLTWDVSDHLSLDVTGRYTEAVRVRMPSTTSAVGAVIAAPVYDVGTFKGDYKDASVSVGLRYRFGGHAAPPPPPPPPPPEPPPPPPPPQAPPPPPATAEAREFVVYFPFDQSILTTDAQAVVQAAASYAQQGGATRIVVVGHTDTSGSAAYNVRLSERRAKTVADALVGLGVNQTALQVDWKGESDPAVQTGDGVKEPLNRRATIDINFGS